MSGYEIKVIRRGESDGSLSFLVAGEEQFKTACWERVGTRIPATTYTGCSTTIMEEKGHHAVFIPDSQTGRKGIFIHKGSRPEHSTGCIVCSAQRVDEIYRTVQPRNARNITVKIYHAC